MHAQHQRAWEAHVQSCNRCSPFTPRCREGRAFYRALWGKEGQAEARAEAKVVRSEAKAGRQPTDWWRVLVGLAAAVVLVAAAGWTCGQVDHAMKVRDCESQGGTYGWNAFGVEGCFR